MAIAAAKTEAPRVSWHVSVTSFKARDMAQRIGHRRQIARPGASEHFKALRPKEIVATNNVDRQTNSDRYTLTSPCCFVDVPIAKSIAKNGIKSSQITDKS